MSLSKHVKTYLQKQSTYKHLNAFNALVEPSVLLAHAELKPPPPGIDGPIPNDVFSQPIAIKDNICTTDFKTTASSGILKDFISPYDATVVKLLKDAGAVVVGKTNMDEFGMGSHSTHSHFGPVRLQRFEGDDSSAGGSSGGSAVAVASSQCWAALGTDTGGSVRLPAAYTGIVGFKPSYGLLSRYGVIAYANSLDTVGIFGITVQNVHGVFDKLNVHDPKDPTSLSPMARKRLRARERTRPQFLRIGVPVDYNIDTLDPAVRKNWLRRLRHLWDRGHTLHPVRLPTTQQALSAYYVLAPAEASSNLAKYDGVRFGSRAEDIDGTSDSVLFAKTRGQGFGPEVQRRILLGAFSLSADAINNYFIQAQKVRRLVQQDFNNVFAAPNPLLDRDVDMRDEKDKVDVLLCPTAPSRAPSLSEVETQNPIHSYMNDVFTVPASLAGLPAITIPSAGSYCGTAGKPDPFYSTDGLQIIGQYGDDAFVLDVAKIFSKLLPVFPQKRFGPEITAWGVRTRDESTDTARETDEEKYGARATELGVSIEEAKEMELAEAREKATTNAASMKESLGVEHLTAAAELLGRGLDRYIGMWSSRPDFIEAEREYHNSHVEEDAAMKVAYEEKRRVIKLEMMLLKNLGEARLKKAATKHRLSTRKYVATFVDEKDPIAAERSAYEAAKHLGWGVFRKGREEGW